MMSHIYVWYGKNSCVTGKALKVALGIDGGIKAPKSRHNIIICYGTAPKTVRSTILDGRVILNNAFTIKHFSNKYLALQTMQSSGVNTPLVSKTPTDIQLPILERPDYHTRGLGFTLYRDVVPQQKHGCHYMQFIEHERLKEYRVHVFLGKVVRIQKKVATSDTSDPTCKSHSNGWKFSLCDIERVHNDIKDQAIKAVQALGYDFGAVDVLHVSSGDTWCLEVNSGMGLDTKGLALYVSLVSDWLNNVQQRS